MKNIIINEDNKSVLDLINYINSKIIELRNNKNLSQNVKDELSSLYNNVVDDWMNKNYMFDIEPTVDEEEEIINNLLEIINFLNNL
jgi:hypothetical protein